MENSTDKTKNDVQKLLEEYEAYQKIIDQSFYGNTINEQDQTPITIVVDKIN